MRHLFLRIRLLFQANLFFPLLAFALWGAVLFIPQEVWAQWGRWVYHYFFPPCSVSENCRDGVVLGVVLGEGFALLMGLAIFFPFSLLASYGFSFLVPKTSRHWFVLEMLLIHLVGVAFAFYTFPIPEKLDFGLLYWPFFNFPPPHFLRGFWGAIIISLYAFGRALSYRYFTITPNGRIVRRR